jgi:hypothetical protein
MEAYQSQPRDVVERIGIMIWKIAVLGIALHCTLLMVQQQGLLDGLIIGSSLLQASALVLLALGMALAVVKYVRAHWPWASRLWDRALPAHLRQRIAMATKHAAGRRLSPQRSRQLVLRGSEWMLALGLEAMLAAQIIQVSMAYLGQNELSWPRVGLLAIIALSRILL